MLAPDEGAFVNFLTLASSDSEYRAKVSGALSSYRLDPLEFEDVRPPGGPMAETFEAYRNRVLSYLGDEEPIGVQQATPSQHLIVSVETR